MSKIKLALVSYINTTPFIEGIKASDFLSKHVELFIDYPAQCADMILKGKVDGGLLPVGAYQPHLDMEIITDYCIGANGAVDTVALFSHQKLDKITSIYLDYQSKTSVQLVQILAKRYWKQDFVFLPTSKGFESHIPENAAILIIGDRVFKYEHLYPEKIDLAEQWQQYTGLPFAFAVWVGNAKTKSIEKAMNKAFDTSLQRIPELYNDLSTIHRQTFINYLTQKIDFRLDQGKREAIRLFISLLGSA